MEKPKNLKGVQQLAGRIAALSRFISRMGEKTLPFYQLLRKPDKFEWTPEADNTFEYLKRLLSTSPVLVTPKEREPLLLYIAATHQVVSTILVVERPEDGNTHGVHSLPETRLRRVHDGSSAEPLVPGESGDGRQRGAIEQH